MEYGLIAIAILAILVVLSKFGNKEEKKPAGTCKTCPEYQYCGGGRPRCARRSERK